MDRLSTSTDPGDRRQSKRDVDPSPTEIAARPPVQPGFGRHDALRIATVYAAIGVFWILGTDALLAALNLAPETMAHFGMAKGWLFVGATAAVLAVALDRYFAQLRLVARSLAESEERNRLALTGASHGVWDWNTRTNEVHFSAEWKSMLGYAPEDIRDDFSEWQSRVHPEDLPKVHVQLAQHLEGRTESYTSEHRLRCKDGSWKWVLVQGKIINRAPDGQALRLVGTHSDIHRHKLAEEALTVSEGRFRALFDHSPDGVMLLDAGTLRALDANDTLCRLLGIERNTVATVSLSDLHPPESLDRVIRHLGETGVPTEMLGDVAVRRRDASEFYADVRYSVFQSTGQRLVMAVFRDVSERRQAAQRDAIKRDLLKALAASTELETGLNLCLEAAIRVTGLDAGGIYLRDLVTDNLELRVHRGLSAEFVSAVARIAPESPQAKAVEAGEPILAGAAPLQGALPQSALIEGLRSLAAYPFRNHGRPIGCLNVASRTLENIPAPALAALEMIAAEAGQAIARLQAEARLLASEANFRQFFESIDDLIFISSNEGRFLVWNPAAERKLGYDSAEFAKMGPIDLHPSSLHAEAWDIFHALLAGRQQTCPLPIVRKDGSLMPAETRVWRGEWNGAPCLIGVSKDLTAEQEARLRFEQLFRSNPLPMALSTLTDLRCVDVNDAWVRLVGFERTDAIGRNPEDLNLFPNPQFLEAPARRLRETGAVEGVEMQLRSRNGAIHDGLFSAQVLEGQHNRYFLTVMLDVTERKRAEAALREGETRFRALIENAPDGVVLFNLTAGITYASPSACRMFGLDGDSFRTVDPNVSTHPEDLPRVLVALERLLRNPAEVKTLEYRFRHTDGHWIWIESTFTNLIGTPGVDAIVINFRNIHDRKQTEAELAAEATRRRVLIEGSRDGIVILDRDGMVFDANRRFAEMLGYSADELRQMHVSDWDRGWSREQVTEAIRQLGPAGANFETQHTRKDGTLLDVELSNSAAEVSGEKLVFCVCHDVTERKRLEQQLRQAQKLEAIGQLAGGVAHDFNNILAAILMQLDLINLTTHQEPDARDLLREVEASARRAAALTRQLLMFSRRSVLNMKTVDLNEVIKDLLKMLGRLIGEDIKLLFDGFTGNLPCVNADVGMMEQVLMNLVVNARDAMPRGGRITIETGVASFDDSSALVNTNRRPGRFVCLTVSDTGVGMSQATLERIFEPFFTTKEPGKGTGLGLATVHGIIAQHKGWVEVESAEGHGTVFRVYLPAREQPEPEPTPNVEHASTPSGNETLLIVEDEDALRRTIVQTLETLGYRVHEAANGQQALELWSTHEAEISLLFTDMVMPDGMSGLELTDILRARKPSLKVVVSSGYSSELFQSGGIHASGVVFLPKPYQAQTLATVIRETLDRPA